MTRVDHLTTTFLDQLDEETRATVLRAGRRTRFPRGTALMYPGQIGEAVHILLEGCVKVWTPGPEGRETLLGFRGPGEVLGELAVVDEVPRFSGVVAVEDTETLVIAGNVFRQLTRGDAAVAQALIRVLVARLRDADRRRAEHLGGDGVSRVASRLVELVDRFGEPEAAGVRIALPVTQADLAGWTGSSIETVGRALATMRGLGWIETRRRQIVVRDLDAVCERAGT